LPESLRAQGGGFKEIMRKNREASEKKKIGETGGSPVAVQSGSGASGLTVEDRLSAIERKLDKLLQHFEIRM
jgi:hypothetical protein